MAPSTECSRQTIEERVRAAQHEAIAKLSHGLVADLEGAVGCRLLGAWRRRRWKGLHESFKLSDELQFEWSIKIGDFSSIHEVRLSAADVLTARTLVIPSSWNQAIKDYKYFEAACDAAKRLILGSDVSGAVCTILGVPRAVHEQNMETQQWVGCLRGGRSIDQKSDEFVLCWPVTNTIWVGLLATIANATPPAFHVTNLEIIETHQTQAVAPRPHPISNQPHIWPEIMASAQWKAEHYRSWQDGHTFQTVEGYQGFARDPFEFGSVDHYPQLMVEWVWSQNEAQQRCLLQVSRKSTPDELPCPSDILMSEADLGTALKAIAKQTVTQTKAPCEYLGLEVFGNRPFEPNPMRWPHKIRTNPYTKAASKVWFEWKHVSCSGKPHRVHLTVRQACSLRPIPMNPLSPNAPTELQFTMEFLESLSTAVRPGIKFLGLCYDGELTSIVKELPHNGIDMQDEAVYWLLPGGQCICKSLNCLAIATEDELADVDAADAYQAVASAISYQMLGVAEDAPLVTFRDDPGTLSEAKWDSLDWRMPEDETCGCWWITNINEEDQSQPPRLLYKSLFEIRDELMNQRIATTQKLLAEMHSRRVVNARAAETLTQHEPDWSACGGPPRTVLTTPTHHDIQLAKNAAELLSHRLRSQSHVSPDATEYARQVEDAAHSFQATDWDSIRKEKFHLTPYGLYAALAKTADMRLTMQMGDQERRQARLSEDAQMTDEDDNAEQPAGPTTLGCDKFGLDLSTFKQHRDRKPYKWMTAVRRATEVHLDEMRALLDIHYDDVHFENCVRHELRKIPKRDASHTIFRSVLQNQRKHLNQKFQLPRSIKNIFKSPSDERHWNKINELHRTIVMMLQGKDKIQVTPPEAAAIATAIDVGEDNFQVIVKENGIVPPGTIVHIKISGHESATTATRRQVFQRAIRASSALTITLPQLDGDGEITQACLSPSARRMLQAPNARSAIAKHATGRLATKEAVVDELLIVLWDILFASQARTWTVHGQSNTPARDTFELAYWFLRGQQVGSKEIFDGICAQCGALLYGDQNQNSALSNKRTGPPTDHMGKVLVNDDGNPCTDAAPPFLLRFSPQKFAREIPAVFEHDPRSNRLSLKTPERKPWLKPDWNAERLDPKPWLYCIDCKDRWLPENHRRAHAHVPFRDKASQCSMKPVIRNIPPANQRRPSANENYPPIGEKTDVTRTENNDSDNGEEDEPHQGGMLSVSGDRCEEAADPKPTLEQYRKKWNARLKLHSRPIDEPFSADNLIPLPNPNLWQDCPFVPFDELKSDEAQARLSVCRPISGLEPAGVSGGVPQYASITGDVCFRRRAPLQLAATLGFILNKNSGSFLRLSPQETKALHECLTWARDSDNNKVLKMFGTVFEAFQAACGTLMSKFQSVMPEGSLRARIRASRRESKSLKPDEIGNTLEDESRGMVVVDGSGHPMKYDKLGVFTDIIATQAARVEIDVPGPDGKGWQKTNLTVEVAQEPELNQQWRSDLATGAQCLLEETWVPANDPHYDAKCWPCAHPHGTGSLLSEAGSGGNQRLARARLTGIQSWFRRSALWGFWSLDRLIKTALFFKHKIRKGIGANPKALEPQSDPYQRLFGTVQPADIPETSAWWKRQQKDLFAISDEAELGMMQAMVTITQNDSAPEMLAAVRRGPFAKPTESDMIEYLITRKPREQLRPNFEAHSLEHVLSFQRRVHATKQHFMKRGTKTPLGVLREWWDRTEAQMRSALHSHILCWFTPRPPPPTKYEQVQPVPRIVPGYAPRQRPHSQEVPVLDDKRYVEDDVYHRYNMGPVNAEMVRPQLKDDDGYAYDWQSLRVAGLARSIQSRLYLHSCSPKYCLQDRTTCRFFFPWPKQPQQQYDANTERIALRRRCPEDDQWVVPHNTALAMFSPATINVLPFDPKHGAEQARQYAAKYASKPEKWYFLETNRDGVKDFLKCRTVGLCMCHNRLLNFHVVRSTRPVQFIPTSFVQHPDARMPREETHKRNSPLYPDRFWYLGYTQKYFFRSEDLRHLRVEQFNRYFTFANAREDDATKEDTCDGDEVETAVDVCHRHFDRRSEDVPAGTIFPSNHHGLDGARRRMQARLGISRAPCFEPIGEKREAFYEQRLLLSLAWFCSEGPVCREDGRQEWTLLWDPPGAAQLCGVALEPRQIILSDTSGVSFEQLCADMEQEFGRAQHDLLCPCCALIHGAACTACQHAIGFHACVKDMKQGVPQRVRWKKGALHGGCLDVQLVLLNLHRRGLPTPVLHEKAGAYVKERAINEEQAKLILHTIEQERKTTRMTNEAAGMEDGKPAMCRLQTNQEIQQQLERDLAGREMNLRRSPNGEITEDTDQWRVYSYVTQSLSSNTPLLLMVQASAGTGKSYLLSTIYLWCLLNGKNTRAAAPTGIAAANIEIEGTGVSATTIHNLFDLDQDLASKLIVGNESNPKVAALAAMDVLLLDEVSMMDVDCYHTVTKLLATIAGSKNANTFGRKSILFFGDFKQLPPATSRPPFITAESFQTQFEFRTLTENRRVATGDGSRNAELETFHQVLHDISLGKPTARVRDFFIDAYVRGASIRSADEVPFEGFTSVFTKRKFRDRWNRQVVHRIARVHNHSIKVKGRVRPRGTRGQQWYSEQRVRFIRRRVRTQAPWNLHLAGDWHESLETKRKSRTPHLMRVMLVANLAVDQRFANGTQGRVLYWHPDITETKKAISSTHPELIVRFAKETALSRKEMLPEVHFIDVTPRSEGLARIRGEPILFQLSIIPAYALTIHKVQALSIKHGTLGCLEGVFAQGQVYVLVSRVTDPLNFHLIGIPPIDMMDDVCEALRDAGHDILDYFKRACTVSGDWKIDVKAGDEATVRCQLQNGASIQQWFSRAYAPDRSIPVKQRTLKETLNPQPEAATVIHAFLDWIERADQAARHGHEKPPLRTAAGQPIFPPAEAAWWLTDVQRKAGASTCVPLQSTIDDPHIDSPTGDCHDITEDEEGHSDGDCNNPATEPYRGYFERQIDARCGMHALNNALGMRFIDVSDMIAALQVYLHAARVDGLHESPLDHVNPSGWYSIEVMAQALTTTAMMKTGRVTYELSLEPLFRKPKRIKESIGAIVNIDNEHWVAIRHLNGRVWLLDSMREPVHLAWASYISYVQTHHNAFALTSAPDTCS